MEKLTEFRLPLRSQRENRIHTMRRYIELVLIAVLLVAASVLIYVIQ